MKKSKHIQLVLISAALASCHRTLLPQQNPVNFANDSTLTETPYYDDSTELTYSDGCSCEDYYQQWRVSFQPYTTYYLSPGYSGYYYGPRRYRKGTVRVGGGKFIVRAGFGYTGTGGS